MVGFLRLLLVFVTLFCSKCIQGYIERLYFVFVAERVKVRLTKVELKLL